MPINKPELNGIAPALIGWYHRHVRPLPWREEPTPYRVWVSEIMLQQTRIEAVLPYFDRFMETLPDIRALAEAEEDLLLKLWEGLGYYSRVRNLQKAARMVMSEYDGRLPDRVEDLLRLPGIGDYTAGAVASIAYGRAGGGCGWQCAGGVRPPDRLSRGILRPAVKKDCPAWCFRRFPKRHPAFSTRR